jgi:hypothetical protein
VLNGTQQTKTQLNRAHHPTPCVPGGEGGHGVCQGKLHAKPKPAPLPPVSVRTGAVQMGAVRGVSQGISSEEEEE